MHLIFAKICGRFHLKHMLFLFSDDAGDDDDDPENVSQALLSIFENKN